MIARPTARQQPESTVTSDNPANHLQEHAMIQLATLQTFVPSSEFLVCIDSDGCVLDTMEVKVRQVFIPQTLRWWGLSDFQPYAQDVAEFVFLYSQTRGLVRYELLVRLFELLAALIAQQQLDFVLPDIDPLRRFVSHDDYVLSLNGLEQYRVDYPDTVLDTAVGWVNAIDAAVKQLDVAPMFNAVRETLAALTQRADAVVISMTPTAQLRNEWQHHQLLNVPIAISGQEDGHKSRRIAHLRAHGYMREKVLMIGDSPGDLRAAHDNDVAFYPILAGQENAAWETLLHEGLQRFFNGSYHGDYENQQIAAFNANLPADPSWLVTA